MNFDPELMQDFLTESGELLEQLDTDLVTLESAPTDLDLLNRIFRALHTIKGSASFLALTNLVEIAHAAETCLNAARNGQFVVDRPAMDALLAAVDTVKKQFDNIRAGEDLVKPDRALVVLLTALGEGKVQPATKLAAAAPAAQAPKPVSVGASVPSASCVPAGASTGGGDVLDPFAQPAQEQPLALPPSKADLLDFLVADVEQTLTQISGHIAQLSQDAERASAAAGLGALAETLGKSVDFFDFAPMTGMAKLLDELAHAAGDLDAAHAQRVIPAAGKVVEALREQCQGLGAGKLVTRDLSDFSAGFRTLLSDAPAEPPSVTNPDAPSESPVHEPADATTPAGAIVTNEHDPAGEKKPAPAGEHAEAGKHVAMDQTIRVEVGRLEALLNLVGELVLQKNRIGALGRQLVAGQHGPQDFREAVTQTTGALDRVTTDLQLAVMKTRMQPMDKLFGKYPRLIRDLARKLNKKIDLVIQGGETEVDKSVIEELGDPLVHLMRNSADHGIEMPEARVKCGKPETGTITIAASNAGGHVEIRIIDDGKGLSREFLARKAVEKGLYTQSEVDAMSEREVYNIIFAAGFSTAEKISDVSGRGVGMDVVRTNIEKLKGTIELQSEPGKGCTVLVKIPLTVAIMSAMMVGVGKEVYAVPLSSIVEIVKPEEGQLSTINGSPVMRLRDGVLPLLDAGELFRQPGSERDQCQFAVVLQQSEKRLGLMVSRLIGQQEIVIKPLDEMSGTRGPVSGATVRDDGGVSLIADVVRMFQIAEGRKKR